MYELRILSDMRSAAVKLFSLDFIGLDLKKITKYSRVNHYGTAVLCRYTDNYCAVA